MRQRGPVAGQFTSTGTSTEVTMSRSEFNVSLSGVSGSTVDLERTFDGSKWFVVRSFTDDFEGFGMEAEADVTYRFNCTSHGGGTIDYRIGARLI